jgi:hypothetical protein
MLEASQHRRDALAVWLAHVFRGLGVCARFAAADTDRPGKTAADGDGKVFHDSSCKRAIR